MKSLIWLLLIQLGETVATIDGVSIHVRIVGDHVSSFFLLFCLVQKFHVELLMPLVFP
jgi:hypothetical protein